MPSQAVHAAPAPAVAPTRPRPQVDHRRMAKIIVRYGTSETTHELTQDVTTVGRSSQNTVALKDISLSRTHCELRRSGANWMVHDLGSRNGTTVNGSHVKEKLLEVGDKIEIGNTVIIYEKPVAGRDYTPKEAKEPDSASKAPSSQVTAKQPTKPRGRESDRVAVPGLGDVAFWVHEGRRVPRWIVPVLGLLLLAGGGFAAWQAWSHRQAAGDDKNLVKQNPSFEGKRGGDGLPEGWKTLGGTKALVAVVQTQFHTGANSLLIDKSQAGGELVSGAEYGPAIQVEAGASYAVSAWSRSEGFRGGATLRIRWFAAGSDLPLGEACAPWAEAPADWKEVRLALAPPAGTARMSLGCVAAGLDGKVYFDDVSVERASAASDEGTEVRSQFGTFTLYAGPSGGARLQRDATVLWTLGEVGFRSGGEETRQGIGRVKRISAQGRTLRCEGALPDPADSREVEYATEWSGRGQDAQARISCRRTAKSGPLTFSFRLEASEVKSLTARGTSEQAVEVDGAGSDGDLLTVELTKGIYTLRFVPPAHVQASAVEDAVRVTCEFRAAADDPASWPGQGGEALLLVGSGKDVAPPQAAASGKSIAQTLEEAKRDEQGGRVGEAITGYRAILADDAAGGTREALEAQTRVEPLEEAAASALAEGKRLARLFQLTGSADIGARATRVLAAAAKEYAGCDAGTEASTALDEVGRQDAEAKKAATEARAAGLFQLAEGAAHEGHWNLAETFLRRVVAQFPETDWALKAQEMLEKGPQ